MPKRRVLYDLSAPMPRMKSSVSLSRRNRTLRLHTSPVLFVQSQLQACPFVAASFPRNHRDRSPAGPRVVSEERKLNWAAGTVTQWRADILVVVMPATGRGQRSRHLYREL